MTNLQIKILSMCLDKSITLNGVMKQLNLTYKSVVDIFDDELMACVDFINYGDDWGERSVQANNKGVAYVENVRLDKHRWRVPVIISIVAAVISLVALAISIVK